MERKTTCLARKAAALLFMTLMTTSVWASNGVISGDGTKENPYLIEDASDWKAFAKNVNTGKEKAGYYKLVADITTDITVGTTSNKFSGSFDGQGHTITIDLTSTRKYCAPFLYVLGASFKQLAIDGTIHAGHKFAAGFIGSAMGQVSLEACRCSVNILSSVDGDGSHGGFIGCADNGSDVTFLNCIFDGSIIGEETVWCGGFIGWRNGTATLTNCLQAGTFLLKDTDKSSTYSRNNNKALVYFNNTYYVDALGSTENGVETHATGEELQALLGDGWVADGDGALPCTDGDYHISFDSNGGSEVQGITQRCNTAVVAPTTPLRDGYNFVGWDREIPSVMPPRNLTIKAIWSYIMPLEDNQDNSALISTHEGEYADVTLSNRTLYRDGYWNTMCLPFDVMLKDSLCPLYGEGAKAMVLNPQTSTFDSETGILWLNFTATDSIPAGTPFLIKWTADQTPQFNPATFCKAIINYDEAAHARMEAKSDDGTVSFCGTFTPTKLKKDITELYIGANNKLRWPNVNMAGDFYISAYRTFFRINNVNNAHQAKLCGVKMNSTNGETTGISMPSVVETVNSNNTYYNVSGQQVNKDYQGIVIMNGKKVMTK